MSLLPNLGSIGSGDSDFYKGVATTSVKFEDGNTPFLAYTPGSAGDRRKWVWAAWIKRSNQGIGDATLFGSVNANTSQTTINILNAGAINVSSSGSGLAGISITSTNLLRDSSAWYHLAVAIDTTQGTSTNRVLVYLNGSQVTDLSATTYPNENTQTTVNEARALEIGRFNQSGVTQEFDGYLAEVNFTEGVSFFSDTSGTANSSFNINSFGENKNEVWIPIDTSGLTFGDNGFRLQFKQVKVGTGDTDTIGADTSGISTPNHLTSSGIVVADCAMPDSPENNFCTGNTIGRVFTNAVGHNPTYTDGALKFVTAGNSTHAYGTMAVNHFLTTGCYFEVRLVRHDDNGRTYVGIADSQSSGNDAGYGFVNKAMTEPAGRLIITTQIGGEGPIPDTPSTWGAGDIIGIAVKGTKWWFSVNGVYSRDASDNVGNPSSGANAPQPAITDIANNHYLPYAGYHSDWTFNFGQNPSFSGALTDNAIGSETADEGPGKFKFAVPTGFVAMCSANMEEPLIGANSDTQANDHMQAVIYEGDGSVQNIPVNFKPDLTWIKNRDATDPHQLFDSSRGVELPFDIVAASKGDSSVANDDTLTDFIATGFTLGDDDKVNTDDESYVSWNWKANGGSSTGSGNESGDNPKFDHQSNTLAGFSIVEYEGTGANGTFAHGVKVNGVATAPNVMWFKHIQGGDSWAMWHYQGMSANNQYFPFNTANGLVPDGNMWNAGVPSATIVNLGNNSLVNRNLGSPSGQGKFVCYCFAEIAGYSRFGTYYGNGNADGPFVFTGFKPAWVLTKRADGNTGNWYLSDTARDPGNITTPLYNDINSIEEGNGLDILSNGFKIKTTDTSQNAAVKHIFMAFAEESIKYSNAR